MPRDMLQLHAQGHVIEVHNTCFRYRFRRRAAREVLEQWLAALVQLKSRYRFDECRGHVGEGGVLVLLQRGPLPRSTRHQDRLVKRSLCGGGAQKRRGVDCAGALTPNGDVAWVAAEGCNFGLNPLQTRQKVSDRKVRNSLCRQMQEAVQRQPVVERHAHHTRRRKLVERLEVAELEALERLRPLRSPLRRKKAIGTPN